MFVWGEWEDLESCFSLACSVGGMVGVFYLLLVFHGKVQGHQIGLLSAKQVKVMYSTINP